MNTTIDTTDITTANTTDITTASATKHGRRLAARSRLLARVLATTIIASAGLAGVQAGTSQAMDIGGCGATCDIGSSTAQWTTQPGTRILAVQCGPGVLRINPSVNVLQGYTGGQSIAYRYHVTNTAGYRGTSGWSATVWVPGMNQFGNHSYPLSGLPPATWYVRTGVRWTVQVQVAYQTSNGWAYSNWESPRGYSQPGSTFEWAHCYT